jgi:hypothetical protein
MTEKINIITAPDLIFNQSFSILTISPKADLKKSLEDYVVDKKKSLNLYFFFSTDKDFKWLLTVLKHANIVIADLDNFDSDLEKFTSYLLSFTHVYYRSNHDFIDWSILNTNRFYDFSEIKGL